ncbi:hypothetical protein CIK05_07720 [Bdellovibrio sp. qaytius]|nr:hypothetical protein CIK05_07720 [Bdellovibrio sp. qaytius]
MTKQLQFLNSKSLVHILMFGLLSIIVLSSLYLFNFANFGYQIKSSEKDVKWLLILFSYPHFIASYFWFYKNENLRQENRFVGKLLPLMIVGILVLIFTLQVSYLLQAMLIAAWILLFWHFAKQSYGCSVFLAEKNLTHNSKAYLLYSYLSLAGFGFLNIQRHESKVLLFKSYVRVFNVPEGFALSLLALSWILFIMFIVSSIKANQEQSKADKLKSILVTSIPWIANLMWFSWWAIEGFFVLIPVFHAIQYAPFILQGVYKLQADTKKFVKSVLAIFMFSVLFFVGLPFAVNQTLPQISEALVTSIFIFFNLHHFFIDSVGWKLSKESIRKILFA